MVSGEIASLPRASWQRIASPVLVLLALLGLRSSALAESDALKTFVVLLISIVVEALPFVLLGALVAAIIEVYVPDRSFARLARLPLALQIPVVAFGGFAFPVCECGSVPVARRLIGRGVHPAAGLTFMLASPILNPIVLISTYIAYRGFGLGWEMVLARGSLGFVVAVASAKVIGGVSPTARQLLKPTAQRETSCHGGPRDARQRAGHLADHFATDFLVMGKFVVVGATLAALLQTVVPRSVILPFASNEIIATVALMVAAFALSLCSEADAFVAVSFAPFGLGPQLAFMVFGPVVDAKLSLLYGATFRKTFVPRLVVVAAFVVLIGSMMWTRVFL